MSKVTEKPYAPACERNQQVILDVLKRVIRSSDRRLLEIGSGTGQHAVFMAPHFVHLEWQTSDLINNHAAIQSWLDEAQCPQIKTPVHYQVGSTSFPEGTFDVVFTANTLHIMAWQLVQTMVIDWGIYLNSGTRVVIYGPFNYNHNFTSSSNESFNQWLKEQNSDSGIRDFEAVVDLMSQQGFNLREDVAMPANNRCLIFEKC